MPGCVRKQRSRGGRELADEVGPQERGEHHVEHGPRLLFRPAVQEVQGPYLACVAKQKIIKHTEQYFQIQIFWNVFLWWISLQN